MESTYNVIRYEVAPPFLVVVFSAAPQLLLALAAGPATSSFTYSVIGNTYSWSVVMVMILWALCSLWVPGKQYEGPITKDGYKPIYKSNGMQYFIVSIITYIFLIIYCPNVVLDISDNFPQIIATCNIIAFMLCVYLLVSGKKANVSKGESEPTHPFMYEFYRGMELHPRLLGVDVKQLTNCRFGLMAWQLLVITFFAAGWLRHGFSYAHMVNCVLQTIYLAKFYWWETGYFTTLDITLDRAGYYICWGCIVWVPVFYTYTSYYLIAYPPIISDTTAFVILTIGLISILLNYRVDWEKEYFRNIIDTTPDDCILWGKPVTFIKATYESSGCIKHSTLLTSGFWGIARHTNYVFEILLALSWCLPGYGHGIMPFLYVIFLAILLIHRIFRDEEKCRLKYGSAWVQYCKVVPYRMIPNIF